MRVAAVLAVTLVGAAAACRKEAPPAPPPPPDDTPVGRAVAAYDEGRYEEARAILDPLDAQGKLSGPDLYRLGYTYIAAVEQAGPSGTPQPAPVDREAFRRKSQELMDRALVALEREPPSLEVSFFLANARRNVGRTADARAAAAEATSRVEAGTWPAPTRPLERFRLAKLYADQGRAEEASRWYRQALEGFAKEAVKAPGYVRWAHRYLGDEAFARAEFKSAEENYAALAAAGGASPADLDRLAVSRVRLGAWGAAAEAWNAAERLDPPNADRPRYCRHLARMAETVGSLPSTLPSGRELSSLSKEELETVMQEQVTAVRSARREAATTHVSDPEGRRVLEQRIEQARPIFVAAALEYAVRNLDIRETAFVGGFAPLIFHEGEWRLSTPEPGAQ